VKKRDRVLTRQINRLRELRILVRNLNILVADSERIILEDIAGTIESLGDINTFPANSGEDAIDKANEVKPDLLVIEAMLRGGIDGTDVAKRIVEDFDIPVIFLVDHLDETLRKSIEHVGRTEIIIKPFIQKELRNKVNSLLGSK
jgi:CheY-like chemotaxis protein